MGNSDGMMAQQSSDPEKWSVEQYLGQGEIWFTDREGPVKVSNMSPGHKSLAMQWLERHSTPLISLVENQMHEDLINGAEDVKLSHVIDLVSKNSRTWICQTVLYRALADGIGTYR